MHGPTLELCDSTLALFGHADQETGDWLLAGTGIGSGLVAPVEYGHLAVLCTNGSSQVVW